jgi:hypothetical protein
VPKFHPPLARTADVSVTVRQYLKLILVKSHGAKLHIRYRNLQERDLLRAREREREREREGGVLLLLLSLVSTTDASRISTLEKSSTK